MGGTPVKRLLVLPVFLLMVAGPAWAVQATYTLPTPGVV
jgi:hypothetical protein